ncbi:MAG TPA: DUF5519 family protein [Thermoflexales bacterium]|nr:DUF5519 family protein [Thermoflexales bacterium]
MNNAFERIRDELLTWDGITTRPGRFGAVAFHVGAREVGHLHGSDHADLPFPRKVRAELVESGRAIPHYFLPDTGWVTFPMRGDKGVDGALALFRLNYELITKKKQFTESTEEG